MGQNKVSPILYVAYATFQFETYKVQAQGQGQGKGASSSGICDPRDDECSNEDPGPCGTRFSTLSTWTEIRQNLTYLIGYNAWTVYEYGDVNCRPLFDNYLLEIFKNAKINPKIQCCDVMKTSESVGIFLTNFLANFRPEFGILGEKRRDTTYYG